MGERYRRFEDADAEDFADVLGRCFGIDPAKVPSWWDGLGRENLRVVAEDKVVGGLSDIPMGWMAGGQCLALHGVAGVGVAPEARGRGIAKRMMASYVRELFDTGVPLSALYASTRSLYRSVGYDIAGRRYSARVRTAEFRAVASRSTGWRRAVTADHEQIQSVYAAIAKRAQGWFDRGPYFWKRVWNHRGTDNEVYVLDEGGVRGWVSLRQIQGEDDWIDVVVVDHGAVDADALRKVAGLLASFAAMSPWTSLSTGPCCPLLDLLHESRTKTELYEPWLLRVVDVKRAIEGRGYTNALSLKTRFSIVDDLVPENRGPWQLTLESGRARLEPVDTASTELDIRGLAALYTAESSTHGVFMRGLCNTEDTALDAAFAGRAPSIQDTF